MNFADFAIFELLLSAGATVFLFSLFKITAQIIRRLRSPLRDIAGPESSHWFYGNWTEVLKSGHSVIGTWVDRYGPTFKFYTLFNQPTLCTMDSRAINHILLHPYDYQKPEFQRYRLANILGEGVLFAEGDPHRHQRRIMSPAFGPIQIRALTDIFTQKAIQLRDNWTDIILTDKSANVDAVSWLSKATLDMIGLAGFNYDFDALSTSKPPSELNQAFATTFRAGMQAGLFPLLRAWIPILRIIPTTVQKRTIEAQKTMARIGKALLAESKAAAAASDDKSSGTRGRDLLSLLVRANVATGLPENQRLSDEDVLAQVPTFLVAGHETTSTATTWALFCLTQFPSVQRKLRDELLQMSTDTPTMDELNSLPYLDSVVRESLRLHSPIPAGNKVAMKDDILPLDTPFVDKNGKTHDTIRVSKGDVIYVPVRAINTSKDVWGADATEFKPERWEAIPEAAHHVPGVWGNQLSFSGGPRACIGYKFSLVEMKALLFVLVRAFEFELAVPAKDIAAVSTTIVQRPYVTTEPKKGNQLPLIIKPYVP